MAVAHDIALTVHPISVRHNYFAGNSHICVGQDDPVKLDLQIPLSEEVPRFLSCFQMALQIAVPWEDRSPKLLKTAEVAQNRVAYVSSGRGEIGFVQGTVEKRSGRHNDFLSAYARLAQKKTEQRNQRVSTPHVWPPDWRSGSRNSKNKKTNRNNETVTRSYPAHKCDLGKLLSGGSRWQHENAGLNSGASVI